MGKRQGRGRFYLAYVGKPHSPNIRLIYAQAEFKDGPVRGGSSQPAANNYPRIWNIPRMLSLPLSLYSCTCHSPLPTQVSSWAPRNYVMHRGWPRLSLASGQSEGFPRTLISFFSVRNLHSSCVPSLCSVPKTFSKPPGLHRDLPFDCCPSHHPDRLVFCSA